MEDRIINWKNSIGVLTTDELIREAASIIDELFAESSNDNNYEDQGD